MICSILRVDMRACRLSCQANGGVGSVDPEVDDIGGGTSGFEDLSIYLLTNVHLYI